MCGIAGVYLLDDSLKVNLDSLLDTMLDEIEHRGGDATGYVAVGDEGVTEWQKAAVPAKDFAKYRRPVPKGTRTILAHTRWATQGLPGFNENNHPLKRGEFFIIHNGHVSNDNELFKLAGRKGYGQVDSEAIAARLASLGKLDGLRKVMEEIEGAAAVAAVSGEAPKDLVLARGHSSPLYVLRTKKIVLFGSTHATVKVAYEQHIGKLPKKAKIQNVPEGTMFHFIDGTFKKVTFKQYSPPKVTTKWSHYTTGTSSLPWQDLKNPAVPREAPASLGWDDDDLLLECDACPATVPYNLAVYRQEDGEEMTWQFCENCGEDFDAVGPYGSNWDETDDEPTDAEFTVVNDAAMAEINAVLRTAAAEDER